MAKVRDAVDKGYEGVRFSGMTAWLKKEEDRRAFARYEETLDAAMATSASARPLLLLLGQM